MYTDIKQKNALVNYLIFCKKYNVFYLVKKNDSLYSICKYT